MALLMALALMPHWSMGYDARAYADDASQPAASSQDSASSASSGSSQDQASQEKANSKASDNSSANSANDQSASSGTNAEADTQSSNAQAQSADQSNNATSSQEKSNNANASTPAKGPIAAIGTTNYTSFKDAVAAAKPGDTVTLLTDVNLTGTGTLAIDNLTINLNGHTISATNFSLVFKGSNAVIRNGGFNSMGGAYGLFYGDDPTSTNVVLEDLNVTGGVNIFNAGDVVLRNVNVDAAAANSPYYAIWCDVNAQVTVEGGNYTSDGAAVLGLSDNSSGAPASQLNIKSGNFYTKSSPLVLQGSNRYKPTISGGTFFDAKQAKPYLTSGFDITSDENGRSEVVANEGSIAPTDTATIPSGRELVSTKVNTDEAQEIKRAVQDPTIASALESTGSTKHLWTVDVTLRDKSTLAEDHETTETFVLSYPEDVDTSRYQDYTFTIVHLAPTKNNDGTISHKAVIVDPKNVKPLKEGLQITSTLSPFAISYQLNSEEPAKPTNPSTPTNPTTPSNPSTPSTPATPTTPTTPDNTNSQATTPSDNTTKNGSSTDQTTTKQSSTQEATSNTTASTGNAQTEAPSAQSQTATPTVVDDTGTNDLTFTLISFWDGGAFNRTHTGHHAFPAVPAGAVASKGTSVEWAIGIGVVAVAFIAAGIALVRNRRNSHKA